MYPVEIGGVSTRGFWLDFGEERVFVAYRDFPWFREFTLRELARVCRPSAEHVRWPAFDIDLELDSLRHPARYPLLEKRLRGDPARVVARLRDSRAPSLGRRRPRSMTSR